MWRVSTKAGAKVVYRGRGSLEVNEIAWNLFVSKHIDPWRTVSPIPDSLLYLVPDQEADYDGAALYCNTVAALSGGGDMEVTGTIPKRARDGAGGCIPPDSPSRWATEADTWSFLHALREEPPTAATQRSLGGSPRCRPARDPRRAEGSQG